MSDIFISYKREDETRVARLVTALQGEGLEVWWDRSLPGGESWRTGIQAALDAAKCAIVVWTQNSVGAAGDFVRDEAGRAKARGVLVPVLLDKVAPPLGFGEVQAIDLTRWRGGRNDPFFRDVVAAVRAKLEGRPLPPARGPLARLRARMTVGGMVTAAAAVVWAFWSNSDLQGKICAVPPLQPGLSDVCGAAGFGGRPRREERLAWESLRKKPGDCEALAAHIARYPQGAFRGEAAQLLAARHLSAAGPWAPARSTLDIYVSREAPASRSEASARAAALVRAQPLAERECKKQADALQSRFVSASAAPEDWTCDPIGGGVVCGFQGHATCELEAPVETCGVAR
jgi:TIR domain